MTNDQQRIMQTDIIIIGAGAAGLAAAEELVRSGIRPLVLEARERVGGRIFTVYDEKNNAPIELGAEFVHGIAPEIFARAREAGLEIVEYAGESWYQTPETRLSALENEEIPGGETIWHRFERFARGLTEDVSAREFLNQLDQSADLADDIKYFENYIAGFHAAEIDKVSVKSLFRTEKAEEAIDGERAFHLAAGYGSLTDYLFEKTRRGGTEFRFGAIVKAVRRRRKRVEIVVQENGVAEKIYDARAAIITLPLGVLQCRPDQEGAVHFEPELTAKQNALRQLEMGAARRVTISFRRKWWSDVLTKIDPEKSRLGFLFGRAAPMRVWWTREPSPAPLLTGWVGGARALELTGRSADLIIDEALESLSRIFRIGRAEVEAEMTGARTFDWQADPFSRGSYSYIRVGGTGAPADLARPVNDTLFFAGEATNSDGYWGTVHGALATGQRAAKELISVIGGF